MADKKVSKVIYGGQVLIDLTQDTVVPDKLLDGFTAHGSNGEQIVGTMKEPTATDDGNGNVTITGVTAIVN